MYKQVKGGVTNCTFITKHIATTITMTIVTFPRGFLAILTLSLNMVSLTSEFVVAFADFLLKIGI